MEIKRQKAEELLQSLREFQAVPRAGLDLPSTIAANAKRAQIEAERLFSISLSMDEPGVQALRQLLSALHNSMRPSAFARFLGAKIPLQFSVLIANVFGAFLGETLRAKVGGEWRLVESNKQTLVALCSSKGDWSLPTYKAGKQFMNGDEDDVWFFYQVMVQKLAPGSVKPILTISTDDLKNPAELERKWKQVLQNARPSG